MLRLLAVVLAFASSSGPPATIAAVPGQVIGVAQSSGSIAWLEAAGSGCRLVVHPRRGGPDRVVRYAGGCFLAGQDLALAGDRAAWGGYQDVRCSETDAAVYTTGRSGARLVQDIPGDCLGYGTSYRELVTDGTSFFYSLLVTRPMVVSSTCGEGGPCRWRLAGGRIVRISGSRPETAAGLPPAALLAGSSGRIALVAPEQDAASNGRAAFDWPRAALNGKVEIYDTERARIVTSFNPRGTVRAVALSATRAVVLVEASDALRIEWYDASSGARLGAARVPHAIAQQISTDGRFVAFAVGSTVHVLDLATGAQRLVGHATSEPVGLSVQAGRLVWGENTSSTGRIVTAAAA